jgi:hypothetical protein
MLSERDGFYLLKLRNNPVLWAAIGLVVTIGLAVGVVLALQRTGDPKAVSDNAPLIAAVIALGGVFTAQMVSIALDDRRTQEARNIEGQRAQGDASQAYLDQMSKLLLDKDLRSSHGDREVRTLARARTLTVLSRLDGPYKGNVVQFLYESDLITKNRFIVNLQQSDLSEADLSGANLRNSSLARANLFRANLCFFHGVRHGVVPEHRGNHVRTTGTLILLISIRFPLENKEGQSSAWWEWWKLRPYERSR